MGCVGSPMWRGTGAPLGGKSWSVRDDSVRVLSTGQEVQIPLTSPKLLALTDASVFLVTVGLRRFSGAMGPEPVGD